MAVLTRTLLPGVEGTVPDGWTLEAEPTERATSAVIVGPLDGRFTSSIVVTTELLSWDGFQQEIASLPGAVVLERLGDPPHHVLAAAAMPGAAITYRYAVRAVDGGGVLGVSMTARTAMFPDHAECLDALTASLRVVAP